MRSAPIVRLVAASLLLLGGREAAAQTPAAQPPAPPPAASAAAAPAARRLTLEEAIQLATGHSEPIDIARAGESRAAADQVRARSQRFPQVSFAGSYSRTLASEFSGAFQPVGPPCAPLDVDPSRPVEERVAELERAASCGAIGPMLDFGDLPFGQRNIYQGALSFSQTLYTGGRIKAQMLQADLSRQMAALETSGTEAQVTLTVTQAFYDAALSDRLVAIAQSGYDQAAAAYEQTRLAYEAGRQPEFELLRAQVARDNERPAVIRNRANRDIAYLRLRQLLKVPADTPLTLDVNLDADTLATPAPFADGLAIAERTGSSLRRSVVDQAQQLVNVRDAAVTVARAERMPQVAVTSSYARVGYPSNGWFPGVGDFRTNWSLGASVQVPIFDGRKLKADELTARADLDEANAQLKQTRELAVLDAATALQDLSAAEAAWQATAGTVEQAQRAYQIAELRNREGLSTQLELNDSRLSLEQAQANRAQAARDLQVARARAALLPSLPLATQ
ncbi:MAG TPA: TolC family protein [Vicinamibacterales bacterium]|jgi:outer membrane protein TolC|nr:TolC family protein [Vicinamibacterales bacterium]